MSDQNISDLRKVLSIFQEALLLWNTEGDVYKIAFAQREALSKAAAILNKEKDDDFNICYHVPGEIKQCYRGNGDVWNISSCAICGMELRAVWIKTK